MKTEQKVIIVSEGKVNKNKNNYIHATGEYGKGKSFQFVPVENGRYFDALEIVESLVDSYVCSIYVFIDLSTSKRFFQRLVRQLNNRKEDLRGELENPKTATRAYIINLKRGVTEPFIKPDKRDKSPYLRRRKTA